jgi:hypothetical protein
MGNSARNDMTNFRIVYEQSLEIDEHNRVAEVRPWTRIELGYEAIQSGWFGKFRPNWLDLATLEVMTSFNCVIWA